jgi:hypothetical protein
MTTTSTSTIGSKPDGSHTDLSLHLAQIFYPLLIETATAKTVLTYKELVERAKDRHPDDADVQKMIPVRMGLVLGVIFEFAEQTQLPRISTLIVGRKGECGKGIKDKFDCEQERQNCYAFDWASQLPVFWEHLHRVKAVNALRSTKPKKISTEQASNIMWEFYTANQANLSPEVRKFRDHIIDKLCAGFSPAEVYGPYLKDKGDTTQTLVV